MGEGNIGSWFDATRHLETIQDEATQCFDSGVLHGKQLMCLILLPLEEAPPPPVCYYRTFFCCYLTA